MEFIFGALAGVSGILPFVHTNLILGFFQQATPAFAVALAFSHLAFELFPTILFGVPTANQGALALPAQQMVQKGEGMQALFL
ncbi:MAG TPA: tripartite tricarboxylate transporter permease [Candidatus Norongarragalinales archaeon]|nr:tripartite tricarboxylate transporter permease [Candidatus Norongarragalinales archaeon]